VIPLQVPFLHELECFSVFRAQTVEDGRSRFRLMLGYFESAARAHEALAVVRPYYPAASVTPAPQQGLSSLDDTMNSEFETLHRATARVVKRDKSGPSTQGHSRVPDSFLTTTKNTSLPVAAQQYAVQLLRSAARIRSADVPRLAEFHVYSLYRVRKIGRTESPHVLRLGFFRDVDAARRVADDLRSHYPDASVVPVSDREAAHALALAYERTRTLLSSIEPPGSQITATHRYPDTTGTSDGSAPLIPSDSLFLDGGDGGAPVARPDAEAFFGPAELQDSVGY
jgi:hypothetical protein